MIIKKAVLVAIFCGTFPISIAIACTGALDFNLQTSSRFVFQTTTESKVSLKGTLAVRKLNSEKRGQWWGFEVIELHAKQGGQTIEVDPTFFSTFAALFNDGKIIDWKLPPKLTSQQEMQLKGFIYRFQFQQPEQGKSSDRIEIDGVGSHVVEYSVNEKGNILRTKSRYIHSAASEEINNGFEKIEIVDSKQTIIQGKCFVSETFGEEKINFHSKQQHYSMTTSEKFNYKTSKKVDKVAALFQMPSEVEQWKLKFKERNLTKSEKKALEARLAGILLSLNPEKTSAYELSLQLAMYEQVLGSLKEFIKSDKLNKDASMRLFNALGILDTPNSHELLLDVITDAKVAPENRFRAIRAIAQGTEPLEEKLVKQLLEELSEVDATFKDPILKSSFIMVIGTLVAERKGEESHKLEEALKERLWSATNEVEKSQFLLSLGNTRNKAFVDTVAAYTDDNSARVRANAASALGALSEEQASLTLQTMLQDEQEVRVQTAILNALGKYQIPTQTILYATNLAGNSADQDMRYAAIKLLATKKQQEWAKAELKRLLKSEKSKRNFTEIVKLLHD